MAEPAIKEPVYESDESNEPDYRPRLEALEGGGETSEPRRGHLHSVDDSDAAAKKSDSPEVLKEAEHKGSRKQDVADGAGAPSDQIGKEGYKDGGKKFMSKIAGRLGGLSPAKKMLGGGIVGLLLTAVFGFLSLLPGELVHIKEVAVQEIGGVQSNVYQTGRGHLYSTMFFFDKDKNFTGFKATKLRRLMGENRQTKKMIKAMTDNGFNIEFETTPGGKPTGIIKSVSYKSDTTSFTAKSTTELQRAWDIRNNGEVAKKFRQAMEEVVPGKSARWYGKMANKVYRRWGLTRTNWLKDKAKTVTGVAALERAELRLRKKIRDKLFGNIGNSSGAAHLTKSQEDALRKAGVSEKDIEKANTNLKGSLDNVAKDGNNLRSAEIKDVSVTNASRLGNSIDVGDTVESASKKVATQAPSNLFRALKLTGAVEVACQGRGVLGTIEKGARLARAYQLMKFALAVVTIADGQKNGKISSSQMSEMMAYINKPGKDGSTFFSSGGWQYYAGRNKGSAIVNKNDRNKYSVGGGFTGVLGEINDNINAYGASRKTCKTVGNPLVQVGSLIGGVAFGIGSDGTFTLTNAGVIFGVNVLVNIALAVGEQMLIPIVAGTVIDGAEQGMATGNAFTSGFETLNSANAANAGMYPLTKTEYAQAEASYEQTRKTELADMSLKDRLFSPTNTRSFAFALANFRSNFSLSNISFPINNIVKNIAAAIFPQRIALAAENSQCPDQDIASHDLATTPFCNIVPGIPDSVLNDPKNSPDSIDQQMMQGKYIDEQGNAISIRGRDDDYANYLKKCTADSNDSRSIDIIHQGDGTGSDIYSDYCSKHPLFSLYRLYDGMAEEDNQILTGTLDGTAPSQDNTQTYSGPVGDIGESSDSVPCATGTNDLGVVESKYTGHFRKSVPIMMRLCQLTSIKGKGINATGGVTNDGAVVNSRVSGAWQKLGEAAKADGVQLTASSSFRIADSCGGVTGNPACADPGSSPHQLGVALDLQGDIGKKYGDSSGSCAGRAQDTDSAAWNWLYPNAEKFGVKQYSYEAWHWDFMPMSNRCGFGQQ